MKKGAILILTAAIVFTSLLLCAAAPFEEYTYKAILKDTPLYADTDLESEVLISIPQNAVVELNGESEFCGNNIEWQPVKYTTITGYVVKDALYRSLKNDEYDVVLAKAKADKMGKDIVLYETHSINLPTTVNVHDGERLNVIKDGIDYGEFVMVEYGGDYYFVLKSNVTTGLSYNQTIAVIISACFIVAIAASIGIVFLVRKKKRI